MLFSKNSQLILRHSEIFKTKKTFFAGNIQDNFPAYLSTINTKINFQKYNKYISFKKENKIKNINIYNNFLISKNMVENCNTIIYYWPKSKHEAKFQLINLLSYFPINTEIFIVGENSSGIKSASRILKEWIQLDKIDSAKHAILMSGFLKKKQNLYWKIFLKCMYGKIYI